MTGSHCQDGILIVEDEPLAAVALEALLFDLGFRSIHVANDLVAGQALLLSKSPKLAILDVNIGANPVFPLAAELRARGIPIVFSTGLARSELPPEWRNDPIVPKPVDRATLLAALRAVGFHSVVAGDRQADSACRLGGISVPASG